MPARSPLLGAPHCYAIEVETALGSPLLAESPLREELADLIETTRAAFECRCYAWSTLPNRLRLVMQHLDRLPGDEQWIRARWIAGGGSPTTPASRLRERLTSVSGFMQTLLQRLARRHNSVRKGRGSIWARRYRACLLADDAATLVASWWCEQPLADATTAMVASSRGQPAGAVPLRLATPPIRIGPDEGWYTIDDGSPGLLPPPAGERSLWLERIGAEIAADMAIYRQALEHGWALGRPESLTGAVQRLGRESGRGRSRRVHELNDSLGLCGIWG